jgi:hypothetical protein
MKKLKLLFLTALTLLGLTPFVSSHAQVNPYGTHTLTAIGGNTTDDNTTINFDPVLPTTEAWTIVAETTYKGKAVNTTWGSRLFSASGGSALEFYQRPSTGGADALGVTKFNNGNFTDPLTIDEENGTLFHFEFISDGSGKVTAIETVNGKTWSTQVSGVASVPLIKASSHYDVTVNIKPSHFCPTPLLDFSMFGVKAATQNIAVSGDASTSGTFTYAITGSDATAFTITGGNDATPGVTNDVAVAFTPTEAKTYKAALTISGGGEGIPPRVIPLIATVLPLQVSTYEDEHWYQLSFKRQAAKAIENVPTDAVLKQKAIEDKIAQYWKITGTPGNSRIESYSGEEIAGNGSDRYKAAPKGEGHSFKFESGNESTNWQLYNNTVVVNGHRYMNDAGGEQITGYSLNDGGNFLLFIPKTVAPEFATATAAIDFELAPVNEKVTQTLAVAARNLTGTISYELDGADKAAFAIATPSEAWSAKRGGDLTVEFTPTEAKTYSAKLIVKTDGQANLEVALTGKGSEGPVITATPAALAFGEATVGLSSQTKAITVSIAEAEDVIAYEKKGDGAAAFTITESSWTAAAGGTLNVVFQPTEAKEYTASIEITSKDADTRTIALTGTGVATELPVTLSTPETEVWYYIEANKRSGQYYADLGAGKPLEIRPAIAGEDGQWWKVVATGITGQYQLISKAGNQIAYTATAIAEPTAIAADRFYTLAATTATYRFDKREDGSWQIFSNEASAYINKNDPGTRMTDTQFAKNGALPDDGSSVAFVAVADIEYRLPVFSSETQTTWYSIGFQRVTGKLWQANGADQDITQEATTTTGAKHLWKFTGAWDNCKIVAADGSELKLVGSVFQTVTDGSGDEFRLFWQKHPRNSEIGWRAIRKANNDVVNDFEGKGGKAGVYFEDANGGNALNITAVATPLDLVIGATDEVNAADYNPAVHGNIVFQSTATTGQLKDIPAEGLAVNGVVKVEKTFAFDIEYPIGFPFAVVGATPSLLVNYTLQAYNGTDNVFEATTATAIAAGAGYLIKFVKPEGSEATGVTVTFTSAPNPTLSGAAATLSDGYHLIANPTTANLTALAGAQAVYVYDVATGKFVATETFAVQPFEALVVAKGITGGLYENIGAGKGQGLNGIEGNDPVIEVKYYSLQGQELNRFSENGVYIVKKIHASQKVEVAKVLYKK